MSLYKEYSTKKRNFTEMNPFELEGRYLKLFDAMTREELKNLEKEKDQKNSKRNKTYLYYGLSKETISKFKEYENFSEKDKEKREKLIQIKKANFYNNPKPLLRMYSPCHLRPVAKSAHGNRRYSDSLTGILQSAN